ncbi:hypothetical protein V6N12_032493 [Hibiscus sabdariffa]|uniref:Uncharacterized protein n=1 Tax=Hibiscus sabdariffa TaxID=183260 RepID=A0ABR2CD83_9ROSI
MSCSNLTMLVSSKPSLSDTSSLSFRSFVTPFQLPSQSSTTGNPSRSSSSSTTVHCGLRELRDRIESVKNTQKITEAMKLVAAAKVRRAQEAVVNGRPFSESLVEVLYNINEQLQTEDVDVPLTSIRPVKKVALVVVTCDRGLCGGFNNAILKKAEARIAELKQLGLDYTIISVGKKGNSYFSRRPYIPVDRFLDGSSLPTAKEAQAIADDVFSLFVSEEVDKVELLYTKFVSLVKSDPVIHTLLPLSPKGEICDVNGVCVDAAEDEFFRLTTKEGKLTVERDVIRTETADFSPILQFEQDPVQILDALLPLYLNSQVLRALQESLATSSEDHRGDIGDRCWCQCFGLMLQLVLVSPSIVFHSRQKQQKQNTESCIQTRWQPDEWQYRLQVSNTFATQGCEYCGSLQQWMPYPKMPHACFTKITPKF